MIRLAWMVVLLLSVGIVRASEAWVRQHPLPHGNELFDVHCVNESTAIAVGLNGAIIKTVDSGASWQVIAGQTEPEDAFYSVFFVNEKTGWVAGIGQRFPNIFVGILYKTTDGGQSWEERTIRPPNAQPQVNSMFFTDDSTGWAFGDHESIIKTTDGGRSWAEIETGLELPKWCRFLSASFADRLTCWAAGTKGTIIKSSDGGESWALLETGTDALLSSVQFMDQNMGWAVGDSGIILKTTDGGNNWAGKESGVASYLNEVHFVDADTGWVVGSDGIILTSTNGGESWTRIASRRPVGSEHSRLTHQARDG